MQQYDRTDALLFDHYQQGLEGDVAFYVEEARRAAAPVLELGCGTGRILIPVAEAGADIVGLDRAPSMLAVAREKVRRLDARVQRRIELVEGDMRGFSLGRRFGLVMIPYRAFLHLLTVEDQRRALGCVREHLADCGRFVFNVFDPSPAVAASSLGLEGGALKKRSTFRHPETGRLVVFWESFQYDPVAQVLDGHFVFDELDDAGRAVVRTYVPLTLRWVYRYEMEHLLELAGFRVEALYGDFARGPFRRGGEQIWVARCASTTPRVP